MGAPRARCSGCCRRRSRGSGYKHPDENTLQSTCKGWTCQSPEVRVTSNPAGKECHAWHTILVCSGSKNFRYLLPATPSRPHRAEQWTWAECLVPYIASICLLEPRRSASCSGSASSTAVGIPPAGLLKSARTTRGMKLRPLPVVANTRPIPLSFLLAET